MFALDLFNTQYERALKEGAVDKVVSEGGPYDLPGIDYNRPGDASRRPKPSGGTTPRRHPDDPDFMDPDQRRLRAEQERLKKAWAEKNKGVAEETDPFGGYKQSPRAFGVGNFQRIVKANMGNLPTVTLEFADPNDNIVLDRKGVDLISDYYDGLKTDAIKNHFIYRVLPSADEVLTILKRLGWHDAVQPELPGIPRQGELPLQEKKRLDRNTDVPAGDVKVARELQKLRAQYPAARSDVEVVAKSEIDSNERSQQQLAAIKGANNEQDRLLQQLVALDRKQGTEIGSLDNENDRLDQQLKHVEKTNARLAQAIGQMSGRAQSVSPQSRVVDILPNAPADAPSQPQSQAAAEPTEPVQQSKSNAIGRMAQSLGQTRQVQGIDQGPAPSIRGDNVSYIDPVRRAQAAIAKKDLGPMAKRMIDKGVLTRTGTDEGLLGFIANKKSEPTKKSEPVDPMIAKIVSNRQNPQSRVPGAKAKVYHGYDEYNRAKAVGDVEESTVNEFASGQGGDSGNYFQALASAWYNGTFDTGSLQKGIKSQEDVERLLNRGVVCPDGKTRKLHIDYNANFDGVEIYSDDYYEYGDHDDTIDSRTGQKWGPYDFMAFSDEDLSESLNELSTDKLAQYKTASALDAGAADKRGDYERGDKRFAGIVKATKKQFANDLKKHGQQGVAEGVYRGDWVRHPDNPWQIGQIQSIDNGQAVVTWKKTDKRKKAMSSTHAVDALQHARREFSQLTQPTHTPGMAEGSSTASDAVERAILNRIMVAHTDLLMRFGPDKVMQAAEEVAYGVGDVDEIGTSDVSAYVNQVRQILGA